jgi:hypothetical protein
MSNRRRPNRSAPAPAARLVKDFASPEGDDERRYGGARAQAEVVLADQRHGGALEPDHRPDEGVDRDEQGELRQVLAQPEPDRHGA